MADTSSYLKAQPWQSAAEVAKDLGSLKQQQQHIESGALVIDKQKLDLVNQRFGEMAKGFTTLATDPSVTPDKIRQYVQDQVKLGYVPANMAAKTISMIPQTQDQRVLKGWLEQQLAHAQTVVDAINTRYGVPGTMDTGQGLQPIRTSPFTGIRSEGLPIARQQGPEAAEFDPNTGERRYRGVQSPVAAPGTVVAPPPMPGTPDPNAAVAPLAPSPRPRSALPVEDSQPANFDQRFAQSFPRGGLAAPTPLFETGMKQYVEDQNIATAKMQAVKPAIQALKLMPGLNTGPGTEQWTNLVAAAKAWGIVDTKAENDPTVMRQELEKKLAQYVSNSPIAARSDAAQVLAEAASPNPKKQLLPALQQLTKDAITLDRVEAARAAAFESKDLSKYGQHRSTFPQSIDDRAFGLDLMEKDKARALLQRMSTKYRNNPRDSEALKFLRSLDIAKKQGFFTPADIMN